MKIRIAILFVIALPLYAADEMRKLDFLVGDWKGEASVSGGPGKGEHVLQTETVRTKLGGKVLLIEGIGRRKLADGSAGEVVHDAVAMVWFDEAAKKYRFSAWTAARGHVDAWFEVEDENAARWGFDTPDGGRVRFMIALDEQGRWTEVGEYSPDGNRWFKTMEMNLTKVK